MKRVESSMSANLAVTADTRPFEADVRKLIKDYNGKGVDLNVDAETAGFTAHMKAITRPRIVPLRVEITKKSIAQVATFFAGISGARGSLNLVKNLGEQLRDLDQNLPKITAVALGIASIGAAGLNAVHGLGGVAVGLAQLAPLAALLPGFFVAAGLSITTLVLALKDAPKALGSTLTAYASLGRIVSKNFWGDATKPIKALLSDQLPELKKGFATLAEELGNDAGNIATRLNQALGGGVLKQIFEDVTQGAASALPGVNAFTTAFVSLLTVGASFLPAFGSFVSQIGTDFATWVAGAEASGELAAMIQQAVVVVGQLGSSLVSVGSILNGVFTAGGGDAIGGLAAGLATVAGIVNSPAFQTALATIFSGAALGAQGLGAALGPIGAMFEALAPTISTILATSGQAVGSLLGSLAAALAQPAFATGLTAFFAGIQSGLAAIAPALPAVAAAFGSLGQFAGTLAAQLGPVLGVVLKTLAPILTQIFAALEPILPLLGTALITIIQALAPLFVQLITAISPLISLIGSLLAPILQTLLAALMPILQPVLDLATLLLTALMPLLQPLIELFVLLATAALGPLGKILNALAPVFTYIGNIIGIFATIVGAIIQTLVDVVTGNFSDIGTVWQGVWTNILSFGKGAINAVFTLIQGFVNGAIDLINGLIGNINGGLGALKQLTGGAIDLKIGKIPHVTLPHLKLGATIKPTLGGTPVVVGEGGKPESVVDTGLVNRLMAATVTLAQRSSDDTDPAAGSQDSGPLDLSDATIQKLAQVFARILRNLMRQPPTTSGA